jgi:hypothetical protein
MHLLMEDIKKEILQVYSYTDLHMDPAALEGKKTIEILNVSGIFSNIFCRKSN